MDANPNDNINSTKGSTKEAIELQQNFYELSSDWNYYEKSDHEYLKKNIRYSIFGAPNLDLVQAADQKKSELEVKKLESDKEKIVELIYSSILEASRSKGSLYVGTIFNILCNICKENKEIYSIPVFKVKRCMKRKDTLMFEQNGSGTDKKIGTTALYSYCVHYIDSGGRIYKNWTDYVTHNTLPKCLMVLPMGGYYQGNPHASNTKDKTHVWVEIGPSPAVKNILAYFDIASTVLNFGAMGVGVATLAAPIVAPVVLAGTVCGAVSGLYATGRSTQQLIDRKQHQQSISVTDRTARSAWLGMVGGLAGGLASGSTFLLSKAAQNGMTLGNAARGTYNTVAIGSLVINGMGIGNGVYGIYQTYQETDEFSALEVAQVMAHVLFFGNAVMNFQTAQTIINDTQQRVIKNYESSLRSNRHRKAFRRIRRNTAASSGDSVTGDSEIIRGIRSIHNKDDFFAGIVRTRKVFKVAKAEVTFKDGHVMINDNVRFDPVELSQQPMEVKTNTVSAAEPFVPNAESALPQLNKMPVIACQETINALSKMLEPIVIVARTPSLRDGVGYIVELIQDMQGFAQEECMKLFAKLAELALHVVKEHRSFINQSLEQIIHFIWRAYVMPRCDNHLKEVGIDISEIAKIPELAQLAYNTIQNIITKIYDSLENFLQEIVDAWSKRDIELQNRVCTVCSGYVLIDS